MNKNEGPTDVTDITTEAADARAGMLPLDMVGAFADLLDPVVVAKEMPWLAGELTKIAIGKSDISFDERDKRFTDEAWGSIPYFRVLGQSYRLFELWMNRMYESVDGSWQDKARARFAADVITAAMTSAVNRVRALFSQEPSTDSYIRFIHSSNSRYDWPRTRK